MALLKSYGVADEDIIHDYMRTNRNAFLPTIKKCLGVLMLTHNWELVKTCYTSFMAQRELIDNPDLTFFLFVKLEQSFYCFYF